MVIEFLTFYVFIPFIANRFLDGWFKIIPLFLIAGIFLFLLLKDPRFDRGILVRLNRHRLRKSVARVLVITV